MRVLGSILLALLTPVVMCSQSMVRSAEPKPTIPSIFSERLSRPNLKNKDRSDRDPVQVKAVPAVTDQPADYQFPSVQKRFTRFVNGTVGPFSLLRTATTSAIDQWDDSPEEWEQGSKGYGKRFASNFGKNVIRQTTQYGLSESLRLDTGFEKSKRKGFWPRVEDALVQNVTSRTRSGKRIISTPIIAGAYAGSIIPAETWYPDRYSYKDGLRWGTYSLLSGFGINLVREFVFNW